MKKRAKVLDPWLRTAAGVPQPGQIARFAMPDLPILANDSLESFFYAQLEDVRTEDEQPISAEVSAYLVHLLASYTRKVGDAGRASRAFALQFMQASADGSAALKEVGDRALFVAGVVPRSLDRSPVGVEYVCAIGSQAYRAVFDQHRRLQVFAELADGFDRVVSTVSRIATPGASDTVDDLLRVYDRWRQHGHKRDAQTLVQAGVLLDPDHSDDLH